MGPLFVVAKLVLFCAVRCAGVRDSLYGTLIFGGKFLGKVFLTI